MDSQQRWKKRKASPRGLLIVLSLAPAALPAGDRLEPRDLEYRGAFLLPEGTHGASRWGSGGNALTFYPGGDRGGGSLFGAGHPRHDMVGECSIPSPVVSLKRDLRELPVSRQLQPFADIAGSLRTRLSADGLDTLGGLAYLHGRLYWCFNRYYAVQPLRRIDDATHGRSRLTLDDPQPEGPWHVGPFGNDMFHQKRTANYMCAIPKGWSETYVGGFRLATGKAGGPGSAGVSHGPALYAVDTPATAEEGTELGAIALLHYPPDGDHFPDWSPCDVWEGVEWIDFRGETAVVFAGRRGRGEAYYGQPRETDCQQSKGYHCDPYEPELLFYDPAELALVAAGERAPHHVLPYAAHRPVKELWSTCHYRLGAMAFDPGGGRLFVVQSNGERPIVHVWSVSQLR